MVRHLTWSATLRARLRHQVDYTLNVYSMAPFTLRKLPFCMREVQRVGGEWKGISAGGCANYDTVVDNPAFAITVREQPTDLAIELSAPSKLTVGLELIPLPSDPRANPARQKPIATSGNYRPGFCLLEAPSVPPGRYALLAATFEPRQEGPFALQLGSSHALAAVGRLPHEGHGLQRQVYRSEWSALAGTAAGCANHKNYHRNPQLRLMLSRKGDVLLRLRCQTTPGSSLSDARPYLAVDVYGPNRDAPLGPMEHETQKLMPLLTSGGGKYGYPPGGALVPRTTLEPGSYVLVLSTFDPTSCAFELVLYASQGVATLERL